MWQDPSQAIRTHLDPGEQLLWSGQPAQGFLLRAYDVFLIPISIAWTAALAFHFGRSFYSSLSLFDLVFALVLAYGLYAMFGRFIYDRWQRQGTFYGVTNARVLIVSRSISDDVFLTIDYTTMPSVNLNLKKDGRGTILFGGKPNRSTASVAFSIFKNRRASDEEVAGFELIPEGKKVYDLIRQAQRQRMGVGNQI